MTLPVLFKRFLPFLHPFKFAVALNIALVLLIPLAGTAVIWTLKNFVDGVLIERQTDYFWTFGPLLAVCTALKIGLQFYAQKLEATTVEALLLDIRGALYQRLLTLSPGSRRDATPGDAISRLSGDTIRAETLVYTAPLLAISDVTSIVIYGGLLFSLSWQLTLCALVVLPLIMLVVNEISPLVRKASRISRSAESHWVSLAEQRLNALPVVQTFAAETHEGATFVHHCDKVRRMEATSLILQAKQVAIVEAIIALGGAAVLGLGTYLIAAGTLTIGAIVAFLGAISSLYSPVGSLAKAAGRFQNAAAGAYRVAEVLDRQSRVVERPGARELDAAKGQVTFDNVTFSYPQGQDVLHGVSLRIAPGETVALVGPSGGGKSSLLKLLLRQYDVAGGSVAIDGIDVRNLTLQSLRVVVAPVFQDPMIFNGSIAQNIGYGVQSAPAELVQGAARMAAVHEFADKKSGLSTIVGPGGSRLSGGQRQRVALARALYRSSRILILDEATAGVDSETEEVIQAALDEMRGKKTILIVAHRLSSVRSADRVVVIENGSIVEMGKPAELLGRQSRCRELFAPQVIALKAAE